MSDTLQFENKAEREFWQAVFVASRARWGELSGFRAALGEADEALDAYRARSAKLRMTELFPTQADVDCFVRWVQKRASEQHPKPPAPAGRFDPGQPCPWEGCSGRLQGSTATGLVWCPSCSRRPDKVRQPADVAPGEANGGGGGGNHG